MKIIILQPLAIKKSLLISRLASLLPGENDIVCYDDCPKDMADAANRGLSADIIISAEQPITADIAAAWQQTQLLVVAAPSTAHIDLAACKEHGIEVICNTEYTVIPQSELIISLALALLHRLPEQVISNKPLYGLELTGKRWGMIGYDDSSRHLGHLLQTFECELAVCHVGKNYRGFIQQMPVDELLTKSDIISFHLPYSQDVTPLLTAEKLALLKPTAAIINTCQSELIDMNSLAELLNRGRLAGAGIDMPEAILERRHPLYQAPRTIITHKAATASKEALMRRAEAAFADVANWLRLHESR